MEERELSERFGLLLAAHRKRKRLKQRQLADKAGVSVDMIVRLEGATSTPSFQTISKLSTALNVEPAAFFSTDLRTGAFERKSLSRMVARLAKETDETLDWLKPIIEAALKSRR